jgi:two-component system nitrogen regulation response regulator GlnG
MWSSPTSSCPMKTHSTLSRALKKIRPDLPIIVMSAQNTLMTALTAAERGAFEYLPKPFDIKEVVAVVGRALREPVRKTQRMASEGESEELPLIGRSPAMQEIYRTLARLTQATSPF